MPRRVEYDGAIHEFPDDFSSADISKALGSLDGKKADAPSNFQPPGSRAPRSELQKRAALHLANELPKVGREQEERINQEAMTKEAIRAAEMLPFAVAAPFTAGASLTAGAAIMGGAGLAGGIGREVIESTTSGKTKSLGALAASLGIDTAVGAASEVGGRYVLKGAGKLVEQGIGAGKTLLPKLVIQAGRAFESGQEMLATAWRETHKALSEEVAQASTVDVSKVLGKLYQGLGELEKSGKGAWGETYGGLSKRAATERGLVGASQRAEVEATQLRGRLPGARAEAETIEQEGATRLAARRSEFEAKREAAAAEARALSRRTGGASQASTGKAGEAAREAEGSYQAQAREAGTQYARESSQVARLSQSARNAITEMERDLRTAQDQISSHQSLDHLIKIKGEFSKLAWKSPQIRDSERGVFKEAAEGLDGLIKKQIAGNPRAAALYEQANQLGRVQHESSASLNMGLELTKKFLSKTAGRAAIGTVTGGAIGGQQGGVRGALEGAAIGAVTGAVAEKATIYSLRRVLETPAAAPIWADAVKASVAGNRSRARDLAERAFRVAGIPKLIRESREHIIGATAAPPAAGGQPQQADFAPSGSGMGVMDAFKR